MRTLIFGSWEAAMLMLEDWKSAVVEISGRILEEAGIKVPPVDALALARSLKLTVVLDGTQLGRGRIKQIAGRSAIFLRPDERPERLQWAAAHELGESLAWKVCQSLGIDGGELSPRQREDLANQLAKEFLLPFDWFRRDSVVCESDLLALKSIYQTASHELIARRLLDLETPGFVTIFDQGTMTVRQTNGPSRSPSLTDAERRCWEQLRRTREPAIIPGRHCTVRGWCIDSPGWEREIVYAAGTEEGDSQNGGSG
jgi:hypothetical protein